MDHQWIKYGQVVIVNIIFTQQNSKDEWWYVEFDKEYGIKYYEIFQRMYSESVSNNRLNGAFVKLLNSDDEIVYQKTITGYTIETPHSKIIRAHSSAKQFFRLLDWVDHPNRVKKIRLYRDAL